jgi:hypothetical protein
MQWRAEKRAATTAGVPTAKLNQHATAQHVITAKAIKLGQKTPKTTGKLGKTERTRVCQRLGTISLGLPAVGNAVDVWVVLSPWCPR